MSGPEAIGARFAEDWWSRLGGLLITRKQTYTHAIEALERVCDDPIARRAFDRRLGRIVANSHGTLAQPPERKRRA